jgi:hypothetical protein
MATSALQLINSLIDARGRRYGSEEREQAYGHWLGHGRRSLAKTARDLGIAEYTVRSWQREDRWTERAEQEDGEAAAFAQRSLASMATNEVMKSLDVVIALRDDPAVPAKTRLDAAVFVLGIWGVAPTKVSEATVRPPKPRDTLNDEEMSELLRWATPQELMAIEEVYRSGKSSALRAVLDKLREREHDHSV